MYVSYTITCRHHDGLHVSHIINCWRHGDVWTNVFLAQAFLTPRRVANIYVSHSINCGHHVCHDLGLLCKAYGSLKGSHNLVFHNGLQWAGVCEKGALIQSSTIWFFADSYHVVADVLYNFAKSTLQSIYNGTQIKCSPKYKLGCFWLIVFGSTTKVLGEHCGAPWSIWAAIWAPAGFSRGLQIERVRIKST